ncbi:MAG TPA: ComEC/Rec2 family competence protein [Solirubrobacterales bacterium]|nr:ComEC/Rec2 family competence protein [Solirubrobacterales bacterium]
MRHGRPPALLLAGVAAVVALALAHTGEIRARADAALGSGMPVREAALARGFVLGEDERIDAATKEDFRRSGLSHLLAVSGQNVALLALLAMPALAALGIPLRARLVWVLGLIALYVPLAGAGPSIQRAGIMGALALLATLAGRRASRLYALALAVLVTLAIDPRIAADVGWQLSFAAVLGILLLASPLREAIAVRLGRGGWRRALAEGAAMTTAATLATAPLVAFHFGAVSTTTLLANLLALPAVAPAMWLGMLAAAAGQVPGLPAAVLNAVAAPLLAYIAQIAAWCGRPSWAYLEVRLGLAGLLASYAGIAAAVVLALRWGRARRIATLRRRRELRWRGPRRRGLAPSLPIGLLALCLAWFLAASGKQAGPPRTGLRVEVLDVGQGDAILLQPAHAAAILVDGGPPGDGLAAKLRAAGVERLGAAIVTHDQSDHAGGIEELLGRLPIQHLLYAALRRRTLAGVAATGIPTRRIVAGDEIRSGALRLEVIWPPRDLLSQPLSVDEPNQLAVVAVARWHRFSMLLSADAEEESVPIDPGPVDVLKVAHHGSDDAGLGALLDRSRPRLAVISVGAGNPYGHPTAATLATLATHGVQTLRTDRDGTVALEVRRDAFRVSTGD